MTGTGLQRSSARAGRSAWCVSGTDPTSAAGRLVQRAGNEPDSNTGVYGTLPPRKVPESGDRNVVTTVTGFAAGAEGSL